jgi:hypothetical protein
MEIEASGWRRGAEQPSQEEGGREELESGVENMGTANPDYDSSSSRPLLLLLKLFQWARLPRAESGESRL